MTNSNSMKTGEKFILVGYSLSNWGGDKALARGKLIATDGVEIPAEKLQSQLTRIMSNEDKRFIWNAHKRLERLWEEQFRCLRRGTGRSYLVKASKWADLKAATENEIAAWSSAIHALVGRYDSVVKEAMNNLDSTTEAILRKRLPSAADVKASFSFKLDTPLPFMAIPGEEVAFEADAKEVLFDRIAKEADDQLAKVKKGAKSTFLVKRLNGLRDLVMDGTVLYGGAYKYVEVIDRLLVKLPKEGPLSADNADMVRLLLAGLKDPSSMMDESTWDCVETDEVETPIVEDKVETPVLDEVKTPIIEDKVETPILDEDLEELDHSNTEIEIPELDEALEEVIETITEINVDLDTDTVAPATFQGMFF